DPRRQVGELVGDGEGDARGAAGCQGLGDGHGGGGVLLGDGAGAAGAGGVQRTADGVVGGLPGGAGGGGGIELGQRALDVGGDAGRVQGQHTDGVAAGDAAAGELDQVVLGGAGEEQAGLTDAALLQGEGDALRQGDVPRLAVEVVERG